MTSNQWATRYDRMTGLANYITGEAMAEEAWALRMGFGTADEYHQASDEAFAESIRDDEGDPDVMGYSRHDLLFGGNWS